jgi:uncharacterized membrane protein
MTEERWIVRVLALTVLLSISIVILEMRAARSEAAARAQTLEAAREARTWR